LSYPVVNCSPAVGDFLFIAIAKGAMPYQSDPKFRISTPNTQTFQEIEQFSRELCHNLAERHGDQYTHSEVIYGLAAFLTAVRQAIRSPARTNQVIVNTKQVVKEKYHG
jgi:hypothetical protein